MEDKAKKRGFIRPIKILLNILFLTILLIIGVQNAHTVSVDLLWWSGDTSLTMLVYLAGILGGLVVLIYKLINWK